LQKFASQTEAQQHIHFLGTPANALKLIAGLDFFWQSHLREPLPGNLMLAMALEIPVISVFGPGTSEIIRHQETGFAVNLGARDEFARWTKYLIEMPEAAEKLAAQGRKYVLEKYGSRSQLLPYRSAYELPG
jgi:glycosyltransferase involved in cell wall biosynthesis